MTEEMIKFEINGVIVNIDRGLCIGSGNCVKVAPEVFELDAEGLVSKKEISTTIENDRLKEACTVCPVDALMFEEASS